MTANVDLTPITNPLTRKWAEALLSGDYKQGTNCLRSADNKFCCLGVAADLLASELWEKEPTTETEIGWGKTIFVYKFGENTDVLPDDLWARLIEGTKLTITYQNALADMNDSGATFEEIVREVILPAFQGPSLQEELDDAY